MRKQIFACKGKMTGGDLLRGIAEAMCNTFSSVPPPVDDCEVALRNGLEQMIDCGFYSEAEAMLDMCRGTFSQWNYYAARLERARACPECGGTARINYGNAVCSTPARHQ